MSIAKNLGVDDIDGPLMTAARTRGNPGCATIPSSASSDDLVDLPKWLRNAAPADRDGPMSRLATLSACSSATLRL